MPTNDPLIILGNSNSRFSGVTSTMLQVLPIQKEHAQVYVLGSHHLPNNIESVSFWQFIKLAKRLNRQGKPIVFHARRNDEMIQALLARWLFRAEIKILFTSTAQRYHSGFSRWLMSHMDSVISTCKAAAAYLQTPPDEIIPHGIDLIRYIPAKNRDADWNQLGFPGKKGIGIFGRIRESKGTDIFVQALISVLEVNADWTGIVCGACQAEDQTYLDKLNKLVAQAGMQDRILFIGEQAFDKLPELFRSMSIVCALSRNEGFGLTPLEAMASATPVITSHAGAWPDIIEDGVHGRLVKTAHVEETQRAMTMLMANASERMTMGLAARAQIESKYTIEREALSLLKHYKSLASS